MYFEYPKLLFLLIIPALLVGRYLWVELKDRRAHMRVSALKAWEAGGRSIFEIIRHLPFVLRTSALCLIIIAIACHCPAAVLFPGGKGGHRGH